MSQSKLRHKRALLIFKLFASLVIDVIGAASFAFPVVGDMSDLGWAPLSAMFLYWLSTVTDALRLSTFLRKFSLSLTGSRQLL